MNILFHLGHPAHFHLFKHTILELEKNGHPCIIIIKKKDVLEDLLRDSGLSYLNVLPEGKKSGKLDLILTQWKQIRAIRKIAKQKQVNLLCGTSAAISVVGKWLRIPSYNFNEDDAEAVPLYAKMAYPWATKIVAPRVCSVGKWQAKKIAYDSYHELAYLHPDEFSPSAEVASGYVDLSKPFFILRFAELKAHHDTGIQGISSELAREIIRILESFGQVYITSEKKLQAEFETYRLKISPLDIHHVMAYAHLFIGDSQTMSAEAAVLGVPFIRYTDFVGRLSYLKELEEKYQLGFGFKPGQEKKLLEKLTELIQTPDLKLIFQERRKKMLQEKINLTKFITKITLDLINETNVKR